MKKLIIIVVAGFFTQTVLAQSNAVSKHFAQFQRDTSFTKVSVSSRMFTLFDEIDPEDEEEAEILEAMSKLKGVKGLINERSEKSTELYYDAIATIESDATYEELMTVEDADENIQFSIREADGTIQELLMIVGGNKNFVVMSLYGEIDLNSIAKLTRKLGFKGMDQFRMLEDDKNKKK